jgi:hypothetical protein
MAETKDLSRLTVRLDEPIRTFDICPRVVRIGDYHLLFQATADSAENKDLVRQGTLVLEVVREGTVVATREIAVRMHLAGVEPVLVVEAFWADALRGISREDPRRERFSFRCTIRAGPPQPFSDT